MRGTPPSGPQGMWKNSLIGVHILISKSLPELHQAVSLLFPCAVLIPSKTKSLDPMLARETLPNLLGTSVPYLANGHLNSFNLFYAVAVSRTGWFSAIPTFHFTFISSLRGNISR